MKIKTTRADIIWNYIGTAVSMLSGFILLPLLMRFLSQTELGLWYVYIAIGNLAMLFEFGFNPTFARNIVYVISGARRLNSEGRASDIQSGVDWHLLNSVIAASRWVYAGIAGIVALLLTTAGSGYVAYITTDLHDSSKWIAWILFCIAITLNLYFLYSITILRGYGDISGENQAKTAGKTLQLVVSAILLMMGYGLIGAAIGYFVNAVVLRGFATIRLYRHKEIEHNRKQDTMPVQAKDVKDLLLIVAHLAWRDGLVQIALYASTQAMSIFSSIFLGLAETGMYSVLLQLATAIGTFATAYPKSFFPAMQSSFNEHDVSKQQEIVVKGISVFWTLIILGLIGMIVVILPLLPIFKPGIHVNYALFIVMCLYITLVQQHSIFCNYIISMNKVPYMRGYIVAAALGIGFVYVFCNFFHMGAWGIILGQALSQLIYNNWKWPLYLCDMIELKYFSIFPKGFDLLTKELKSGKME